MGKWLQAAAGLSEAELVRARKHFDNVGAEEQAEIMAAMQTSKVDQSLTSNAGQTKLAAFYRAADKALREERRLLARKNPERDIGPLEEVHRQRLVRLRRERRKKRSPRAEAILKRAGLIANFRREGWSWREIASYLAEYTSCLATYSYIRKTCMEHWGGHDPAAEKQGEGAP